VNHTLSAEPVTRQNVYQIVTDQIIRQLEKGTVPWRKSWRTEAPCNLVSGKPYRGINVFLLASQGYESRYWLTFNQAAKLGGHVRKGERSSLVTFWHIGEEKIIRNVDGNERKQLRFCSATTEFSISAKPRVSPKNWD
jgi:antirestriction protein ArdC